MADLSCSPTKERRFFFVAGDGGGLLGHSAPSGVSRRVTRTSDSPKAKLASQTTGSQEESSTSCLQKGGHGRRGGGLLLKDTRVLNTLYSSLVRGNPPITRTHEDRLDRLPPPICGSATTCASQKERAKWGGGTTPPHLPNPSLLSQNVLE